MTQLQDAAGSYKGIGWMLLCWLVVVLLVMWFG